MHLAHYLLAIKIHKSLQRYSMMHMLLNKTWECSKVCLFNQRSCFRHPLISIPGFFLGFIPAVISFFVVIVTKQEVYNSPSFQALTAATYYFDERHRAGERNSVTRGWKQSILLLKRLLEQWASWINWLDDSWVSGVQGFWCSTFSFVVVVSRHWLLGFVVAYLEPRWD